jgi:hypothetical protein
MKENDSCKRLSKRPMCPQRTTLVTVCTSNRHVVFKQRIESMNEIHYDRDWVVVLVTMKRIEHPFPGKRFKGVVKSAQ